MKTNYVQVTYSAPESARKKSVEIVFKMSILDLSEACLSRVRAHLSRVQAHLSGVWAHLSGVQTHLSGVQKNLKANNFVVFEL